MLRRIEGYAAVSVPDCHRCCCYHYTYRGHVLFHLLKLLIINEIHIGLKSSLNVETPHYKYILRTGLNLFRFIWTVKQ